MSGNVWVVNSYHRAVVIATEASDGTRSMSNHYENESTMRAFLQSIPVNLFYIFVQGLLVNIYRKLDALSKCTDIDRSTSFQRLEAFHASLQYPLGNRPCPHGPMQLLELQFSDSHSKKQTEKGEENSPSFSFIKSTLLRYKFHKILSFQVNEF